VLASVTEDMIMSKPSDLVQRTALGAKSHDLLALVVGEGILLALCGVVIGLAGALAVARVLEKMLFGVRTTDLTTFAGVSALIIGIVLIACYVPARRVSRVDPMVALRYE